MKSCEKILSEKQSKDEQRLRRYEENLRKAKAREKKQLNGRRFLIGKSVGETFPALMNQEHEEGLEKLKTVLAYLQAHPEFLKLVLSEHL